MDDNNYHQFSFERPHSKLSELQFTPLDKRSFYSQYDTEIKNTPHVNAKLPLQKAHYNNYASEPKIKGAEGSPALTNNNYSPDTHSLLLPPELYLAGSPIGTSGRFNLRTKLLIFAILSFLLALSELIVGFIANSICLMIDSLRLFYIFKSFFIPYVSIRMHEAVASKNYTYGYQRIEVIVSLFLIIFQWGMIIGFIVEATKRWFVESFDLKKEIMLITAFIGLICNLVLRKTLSYIKSQESFQEIRKAHYTMLDPTNNSCVLSHHQKKEEEIKKEEEKKESLFYSKDNTIISEHKKDFIIANSTAYMKMKKTLELDTEYLEEPKIESEEDPFPAKESIILPFFSYSKASSVKSDNSYADSQDNIKDIIKESLVDIFQHTSVIIAALIIFFDHQTIYVDMIFTYILGAFILIASLRSIKENLLILMEAAPADMDVNIIGYNLRQLPEVTDLHNLHIWKIGPGKIALSVHLKASKNTDLLWKINNVLRRMGVYFMTVQIEEDINYENELVCE